jgi:hypothetical protein
MTSPDREISVSISLPSASSPLSCVSSCPLCVSTRLSRVSSSLPRVSSRLVVSQPALLESHTGEDDTRTRSVASPPDSRASRRRFFPPRAAALHGYTRSKLPTDRSDLGGERITLPGGANPWHLCWCGCNLPRRLCSCRFSGPISCRPRCPTSSPGGTCALPLVCLGQDFDRISRQGPFFLWRSVP